ncbi:MAG: large-conductance mechanosensitive channel protein MscL [Anaerolineae bacterium]|jgi:large conductance mechanosensitive channel
MWKDFREFAMRGNVIDLAIGIIIGSAFTTVVSSLVNDLLMPPIGLLLGNVDFAQLFAVIKAGDPTGPYTTLAAAQEAGAVTLNYGLFINNVITFLIVAFATFLIVRAMNKLYLEKQREETAEPAEPTTKTCPYCKETIAIEAVRCSFCTSELG